MAMRITLKIAAANEHVPGGSGLLRKGVELWHSLPCVTMPKLMVVELMYIAVHWLNAFPLKNGVCETLSPAAIMTGRSPDYKKHCRLKFGSFVQTH